MSRLELFGVLPRFVFSTPIGGAVQLCTMARMHGAHAALLAETPVKVSRLRENPFARECRSSGLLRHCTSGKLVDFARRFG